MEGVGYFRGVGGEQGYAGRVHGDVASCGHGYAEVGFCQGCSVVDAVSDHGDFVSFASEAVDVFDFVFGLDVSYIVVYF